MIVIIGAGIAGTASALALRQAGFDVTVCEAHPDTGADIGAFLTLADNGMRALAQIGVEPGGFPLSRMSVLGADGGQVADVPLGDASARYRCLRRADLAAALRAEAARRGVDIRHSARFASLADGVVSFTDGSSVAADVVIGADGLNSAVRSVVDPAAAPRYAGQHVFYGYTTSAAVGEPERITMVRGSGSAFGYCSSPAGETFWFARLTAPEPVDGAPTPAECRERLLPVLRRDATPTADIVAATADIMVTSAWDLNPGGRWVRGTALLIGDAAHAASPATGQGASMALEDAVVLAKAFRDTAEPFAAYQRLRRERVERNIVASAAATAGRPSDSGPQSRVSRVDESIGRIIDWDTPIEPG
jgi:2-polyprenyl-6-methoxyphenol hydroxylase-like FAD-dependent oxidoreductase